MARLTIEDDDPGRGPKRRLTLLVDGEPWLEVAPKVVSELDLAEGDELDEAQRAAIEEQLGDEARGLVLRSLATRGRSLAEVRRTLASREVPEPIAEAAIETVAGYGYLDDAALAGQIVRGLLERGYGRRRAAQALRQRGIGAEDAAAALEVGFGDADEVTLARAAIARREIGAGERGAARAVAYLERRGFSAEAAWRAMREELEERAGC